MQSQRKHEMQLQRKREMKFHPAKSVSAILLIIVSLAGFAPSALAQFAQPLPPPKDYANQSATPAGQAAPQGQPPPIGDGPTPLPVTPGDAGAPQPPPSGQHDPSTGNWFPNGSGQNRSITDIYADLDGRGTRMNQPLNQAALTPQQAGQVGGILGAGGGGGGGHSQAMSSNSQLEQLNQALYPSPNPVQQGGRKKINSDTPAPGYPKPDESSIYVFQGPLPTVRTFCRYLVILGVVVSTIWMALAAYSMVLGHPYGGSRVIGTVAGLMLLLMGYTIWKIVQMNTFKANSNNPAQNRHKQGGGGGPLQQPNLYGPGGAGAGGQGRSGIPVQPFGNAGN